MRKFLLLLLMSILAACQVNPVTGDRHLQFYGSDWEQNVGSSMYAPLRQSQGGDYKIDPELIAYVQSVGNRLAEKARRKDELQFEFQVLNDSTPNAWALPGGKISINRGLLTELSTEAELAAVLGHEIVHADAAHGARAQSKGVLTQIGAIAGMVLINSKVDSSAGQQAAAIIPALGAQLITSKYGRDAERESDRYGMQYMSEAGYDPQGAVELQETFVRLSEGRSTSRMNVLFASHPPSRERVELNTETAKLLPAGGESGKERYAQKTAFLRQVKPAYDAYDAAIKAAVEEDYATARSELEKALEIEPGEAIFHALDGDLHAESGNISGALRAFNKAVSLDDGFFYHYLRRGGVQLDLGRKQDARSDLENSLAMLPTAQAHFLLGNLDKDAGRTDSARKHYETASQSSSEAGKKAQRELVLMDIGRDPQKFLSATPMRDSGSGTVFCQLGNKTTVDMTNIGVAMNFTDVEGDQNRQNRTFNQVLAGGQSAQLTFNWQKFDPVQNSVSCIVQSARVAD